MRDTDNSEGVVRTMKSEFNEEIDVTYIVGTPLSKLFSNADIWTETTGELHLSDGRRYAYTLRRL